MKIAKNRLGFPVAGHLRDFDNLIRPWRFFIKTQLNEFVAQSDTRVIRKASVHGWLARNGSEQCSYPLFRPSSHAACLPKLPGFGVSVRQLFLHPFLPSRLA